MRAGKLITEIDHEGAVPWMRSALRHDELKKEIAYTFVSFLLIMKQQDA